MSVHDAKPGDIYVDGTGKLWRCMATCDEPTVTMQEVEPGEKIGDIEVRRPIGGGVSGQMWADFKRIHRPEASRG